MDPEQQANEWLATVKDRAMTRAKAEAVAEGPSSARSSELIDIGVLAGAWELLDLLDELGFQRPS